jgi:hypothetical protein
MPGKRPSDADGETPRTDLPPTREPYTDDYFGTDEEEGVEREREVDDGEGEAAPTRRGRSVAEDAAGGDREIL